MQIHAVVNLTLLFWGGGNICCQHMHKYQYRAGDTVMHSISDWLSLKFFTQEETHNLVSHPRVRGGWA